MILFVFLVMHLNYLKLSRQNCADQDSKEDQGNSPVLMSIENEFLEIRSMFDIDDDIDSEMAVTMKTSLI